MYIFFTCTQIVHLPSLSWRVWGGAHTPKHFLSINLDDGTFYRFAHILYYPVRPLTLCLRIQVFTMIKPIYLGYPP